MTPESLKGKTTRYLDNKSFPAEIKLIQTWLSCTDKKDTILNKKEKKIIEKEILSEIKGYTAYPLFFPRPKAWWTKVTSIFLSLLLISFAVNF
jgi:hypothetical protein